MSVIVALTARMGQYLLTPRVSPRYIYPGLCAFALTAHNTYGIRVIIKNAKKHYFFIIFTQIPLSLQQNNCFLNSGCYCPPINLLIAQPHYEESMFFDSRHCAHDTPSQR